MRTAIVTIAVLFAIAGLLIMLFVPDESERLTFIDTRGARTTVEPVMYVDTTLPGTQWPDFIGNSLLLIGLVGLVYGVQAHPR